MPARKRIEFEDDPLWYKDAVIYELHIKAFHDSNADGIGDFPGLIQKLDYLENLGVTAIWLLPFYPSPLRDDGYDIADYFSINPDFGDLKDFREFLREAHRRGIRVITELVLNHTSDQHPWFQSARRAKPGDPLRDFYVWSDTPEKYKDARIIFLDFESSNWSWDPVAKAYYWHRFYSHQPDLNFENPQVQKAMFRVIDFWYELGVDGVRLDAVPYLYEREGTNCENLPETHQFLKKLRLHVQKKFTNKMFLAEANQWPEDAVAYFGEGDECNMAFHFPLMPRIFMALQMEDRFPIVDILGQTPAIPELCQWALFLRNHDELTLEMVTDEERDYMYKVYARDPKARINLGIRRRLAPLVGNSRRKIELMNIILFSLPGTPIIYYGDEIGMGDNYYLGDRDGVRTPMQWSADRNAGFSKANPQKLYLPVIIDPEYHFEALNVESQDTNLSSLLWWTKRILAMRKRLKAFGRGTMEFITSDNPKVLAFTRQYQDETILVVINLSRFSQVAELDLATFAGFVPEEVFGQNRFPGIKEAPYMITMGFHDYFWFVLKKEDDPLRIGDVYMLVPELSAHGGWERVFEDKPRKIFEKDVLPAYLPCCRWYAGKARKIQQTRIVEVIPTGRDDAGARILFIEVGYTDGMPEIYLLPVAFMPASERSDRMIEEKPFAIVARYKGDNTEGIIYDASYDEEFRKNLLSMISKKRSFRGKHGELTAYPGKKFSSIAPSTQAPMTSQVLKAEQSNTSIIYENIFFLKLYRKLEEGMNPDLEMVRFLTERTDFPQIPQFAGAIEYRRRNAPPVVIGQLQGFLTSEGDAWKHTLGIVEQYYEEVLSRGGDVKEAPAEHPSLLQVAQDGIPDAARELIGGYYLEMIALLGKRTGEMHLALASVQDDPAFAPEPFSMLYQRSVYQSMRNLTVRAMQLLRGRLRKLPEAVRERASEVLAAEPKILAEFNRIMKRKVSATKIRYHGDYHLGQVMFTGNDFIIIDFEGEPARPLSERKLRRSPVRDVAGMIRSFHYAAYSALLNRASVRPEDIALLEPWADLWYQYVSGTFLSSYLATVGKASFIPADRAELEMLLHVFLLEKSVYELGYEVNNRPDWIVIPIRGIQHILKKPEEGKGKEKEQRA